MSKTKARRETATTLPREIAEMVMADGALLVRIKELQTEQWENRRELVDFLRTHNGMEEFFQINWAKLRRAVQLG